MLNGLKTVAACAAAVMIAGCGGGGGDATSNTAAGAANDAAARADAAIKKSIIDAQAAVSKIMRDPSSTLFQDIKTYRTETDFTMCGQINSKNGFGAYVGFKSFYYRPNTIDLFKFSLQTTSTGSMAYFTDQATATLIATVCSNITKEQADAAQTTWLKSMQP
jgi:hypothetical protein